MRFVFIFICVSSIYFLSCKKDAGEVISPIQGIPVDSQICTTGYAPANGSVIDGRYIIALKDDSTARLAVSIDMARYSSTILQRNNIRSSAIISSFYGRPSGFVVNLSAEQLAVLRNDKSIDKVENDRVIALGACFEVVEPRLITWNVNRVGYGDGRGKTAWVLDTGIDFTHPDLNVDTVRSKSFITEEPSANDLNGHGTHIAGIIGGRNNSFGILGVASDASLVPIKVLGQDGTGTVGALLNALSYVSNKAKAGDVVNISIGEDTALTILDRAIESTAAKGINIAIAAGNDAKQASQFSPARVNGSNIYTVSATDSLDNFASFSNFGNDAVDYAAPGVNIVSTWIGGKYAKASGTSMATPHVAGLLLLGPIKTSGTAKNDPDGTPDPIAHH